MVLTFSVIMFLWILRFSSGEKDMQARRPRLLTFSVFRDRLKSSPQVDLLVGKYAWYAFGMEKEKKMEDINADLDSRVAGFNEELKALLGKYELALFAEARIHQGQIVADPKIADARKAPEADNATQTPQGEAK